MGVEEVEVLKSRILALQQKPRYRQLGDQLMGRLLALQIQPGPTTPAIEPNLQDEAQLQISQLEDICQQLKDIKQLLSLKASASINYEAIAHRGVRDKLVADNIHMENAAVNVELTNAERFFDFCTDAFHQVENLLNYYFWKKYPDIKDFITYLQTIGTTFEPNRQPTRISHIPAHNKLYAFEKSFYYNDNKFYDSKLQLIRKIRNLTQHRCSVIEEHFEKYYTDYIDLINKFEKSKADAASRGLTISYQKSKTEKDIEESGKLAVLIKEHNYDLVRGELKTLYEKVIYNLLELPATS